MVILLAAALAHADEQALKYTLTLDGQAVGTRDVVVRYLSRDGWERRVVTAHTVATVAGRAIEIRSTSTSGGQAATFSSTSRIGGDLVSIQGVEQPQGGWRITRADKTGVHESTLTRSQARVTTLDVLDPGRTPVLAEPGPVGVLLAETGDLVTGELQAAASGTERIQGRAVPATRYTIVAPGGNAVFAVDDNGILLHSEVQTLGGWLHASLVSVPSGRRMDETFAIEGPGPAVTEEGL